MTGPGQAGVGGWGGGASTGAPTAACESEIRTPFLYRLAQVPGRRNPRTAVCDQQKNTEPFFFGPFCVTRSASASASQSCGRGFVGQCAAFPSASSSVRHTRKRVTLKRGAPPTAVTRVHRAASCRALFASDEATGRSLDRWQLARDMTRGHRRASRRLGAQRTGALRAPT